MKELVRQYAAYNVWAHQKILELILSRPAEQHTQTIPGSFPSLLKTVLHIWDAESIWWQRTRMHERILVPSENFNGSMQDIANGLLHQSKQWEEWAATATDHALEHVCQYQNTKREVFKQPVFQILVQVFNHGSYHRGQLVSQLRQLGVTKIPQTDFIIWSRRKS